MPHAFHIAPASAPLKQYKVAKYFADLAPGDQGVKHRGRSGGPPENFAIISVSADSAVAAFDNGHHRLPAAWFSSRVRFL